MDLKKTVPTSRLFSLALLDIKDEQVIIIFNFTVKTKLTEFKDLQVIHDYLI